jgi:SAM-dependent methyltransferase
MTEREGVAAPADPYRRPDFAGVRGDVTTVEYAAAQHAFHPAKARGFLLPMIAEASAHRVLDVGCGVGGMVMALRQEGYDAHGVDLPGLEREWAAAGHPPEPFRLIDPDAYSLPFEDGFFDFLFSFGVIEHVGTTDGHADRRPDWHEVRRQWVLENLRTLRSGGRMLLAGPNRGFPVDVAHGPDSRAAGWERGLSRLVGATVHRTWGDGFLWSFGDVRRYLAGTGCVLTPRSIDGFLEFSRVPGPVRGLVRAYVRRLPRWLLGTGFNPWVVALIRKP